MYDEPSQKLGVRPPAARGPSRESRGVPRKNLRELAFPIVVLVVLAGLVVTPAVQSWAGGHGSQRIFAGSPAEAAAPPARPDSPAMPASAPEPPPPLTYSRSWIGSRPSPDLGLHAASAVLVDLDHNQVLWQNWPDSLRAPASLTKVMTIMVALDHAGLDRIVIVPQAATGFGSEASTMGLSAGNGMTLRELIYGILLASANDAAETLAQTLIPRARFIDEMNVKAHRLGLRHTHFSNPTGLDAPDHYSSAMDLATMTGFFAQNYTSLLAISSLDSVALYQNVGHPEFDLVNLNKLITWPYPGATGLKTGFTEGAGGCVAATAGRSGRHLVAVVLGSDVEFSDAAALFDYGWAHRPA